MCKSLKYYTAMKTIYCILIFLFTGYGMYSQNTFYSPYKSPPTPEVASILKFTDIPVNNFSGIPSISIPVTKIKLKDFEFPINIKYHASGVKVSEVASSVGLGWTLDAISTISQSVQGTNDTWTFGYLNTCQYMPDHIPNPNYYTNNADYNFCMNATVNTFSDNPNYDTQPDLFYYNIPGGGGKFFYDKFLQVHTMPFDPIKITAKNNYNAFRIIDKKGVIYDFDKYEYTGLLHTQGCDVLGESGSVSWYLTQITLPSNEKITFQYDNISYVYRLPFSETKFIKYSSDAGPTMPFVVCNDYNLKQEVIGLRLSKIESSSGQTIYFEYSSADRSDLPGTKSLKTITEKYGTQEVKKMTLHQSYFLCSGQQYGDNDPSAGYRLRLDSVSENNSRYVYRFWYNEAQTLPSRLSYAQDHWGGIMVLPIAP